MRHKLEINGPEAHSKMCNNTTKEKVFEGVPSYNANGIIYLINSLNSNRMVATKSQDKLSLVGWGTLALCFWKLNCQDSIAVIRWYQFWDQFRNIQIFSPTIKWMEWTVETCCTQILSNHLLSTSTLRSVMLISTG